MKNSHSFLTYYLQYCKRYLEVSSKASNVACIAELGKFPLIIAINQKIINYTLYLHNKENDSIVKDSLLTTMQRAPRRRFRGPRNPKLMAVEICLHPSHPSVEWIEIFLWSYENDQGTIGAEVI